MIYLNQYLANADAWLQTPDRLLKYSTVVFEYPDFFLRGIDCNCSDSQVWSCFDDKATA